MGETRRVSQNPRQEKGVSDERETGREAPEAVRQIPLTQGKFALVDDDDYDRLSAFKWCLTRDRSGRSMRLYAVRGVHTEIGWRTMRMHRELLPGAPTVDHIDGDGLNNQRENLRVATNAQNLRNRGAQKNNTSGFKGVSAAGGKSKRWVAKIQHEEARKHLGRFETPEEAARAYDTAALKLHGGFANLNFPTT